MQIPSTKVKQPKQGGFTLMELVVSIVVICLLIALTMPAVLQSKHSSKKLYCLNRMRNLGLAIVNYSSGSNAYLPLLVDPNLVENQGSTTVNDDMSWCVALLPFLDAYQFRQRWDLMAYVASGEPSAAQSAAKKDLDLLQTTRFPVFVCPDDPYNVEPGALSYCVNIGYVTSHYNTAADTFHRVDSADGGFDSDTSVDTDVPVKFASGVFWRPHSSRMSLDYIAAADGLTQTLMMSENMQAGEWHSTSTGELGFGIDMEGVLTSASLKLPADFDLKTARSDSSINLNRYAAKGQAWRPSSNHPSGSVNVIMCDGSARSLVPKMDARIYARLLTPAGLRFGQAAVKDLSY